MLITSNLTNLNLYITVVTLYLKNVTLSHCCNLISYYYDFISNRCNFISFNSGLVYLEMVYLQLSYTLRVLRDNAIGKLSPDFISNKCNFISYNYDFICYVTKAVL